MPSLIQNPTSADAMRETILTMAVESWRFKRVFDRLLLKLDAGEQSRYINQFRWFMKKIDDGLEQAGLKIVNIEGQPFDPGLAATPLNIEDFEETDTLVVEQMLEPIIMDENGLVKTGTIILKKV